MERGVKIYKNFGEIFDMILQSFNENLVKLSVGGEGKFNIFYGNF